MIKIYKANRFKFIPRLYKFEKKYEFWIGFWVISNMTYNDLHEFLL